MGRHTSSARAQRRRCRCSRALEVADINGHPPTLGADQGVLHGLLHATTRQERRRTDCVSRTIWHNEFPPPTYKCTSAGQRGMRGGEERYASSVWNSQVLMFPKDTGPLRTAPGAQHKGEPVQHKQHVFLDSSAVHWPGTPMPWPSGWAAQDGTRAGDVADTLGSNRRPGALGLRQSSTPHTQRCLLTSGAACWSWRVKNRRLCAGLHACARGGRCGVLSASTALGTRPLRHENARSQESGGAGWGC
jgi:hypothetical protein